VEGGDQLTATHSKNSWRLLLNQEDPLNQQLYYQNLTLGREATFYQRFGDIAIHCSSLI
jgi:hypothetical protein